MKNCRVKLAFARKRFKAYLSIANQVKAYLSGK